MLLVRDTTLYFQEAGKGDVLLFVHGMCGDANAWDGQVDMLAGGFRCVTYDRRGHSRSPWGKTPHPSVQVHADDAAELMVSLGLAPAVIVGSDHGAEVGLDLIRRYPGLVRGAVLSEPTLNSLDPPGAREFWAPILTEIRAAPTLREAVDAFFMATSRESWGRLPEARREAARANHAALRLALTTPPYSLALTDLDAISVPVRLVIGARAAAFLRRVAAIVSQRLPNTDLVRLDEAGYGCFRDQPGRFGEAVRSFAKRLIGAPV
jgi:pimeloyl-ACP methyl ester carboxylesterase